MLWSKPKKIVKERPVAQGKVVPKSALVQRSFLSKQLSDAERFSRAMQKAFPRSHEGLKAFDVAMDASVQTAMDNSIQQVKALISQNQGFLPAHVLEWYSAQGFIGWQVMAVLAQQWLVSKACKMPGQDAVRHGFERSTGKAEKLSPDVFDQLRQYDKQFKLKNNLLEHHYFSRVFGLRHTLFLVDGIDYAAPFNIDGVKPNSYRGMTQIDPYWMAPMFSMEDAANPMSQSFYDPTWWMINGLKIHRSHFVISRNGNPLADILKPTYFYGGLSTVQLIYERIYAAERVANEAPLLAMTKRLLTLTTDTTKAMNDLDAFKAKLEEWLALLNNFGCKVLGLDEKVEQIDTSLAGFDETLMSQYQLVAAIADVPATKLLGTSPKGFGASGDYEIHSYHENLESIQENELSPIVERHTILCQRSFNIAPGTNMDIVWNTTDVPRAKEQSEINLNKANTDAAYVNSGVILGEEVRNRLITDQDSGYNGLEADVELPDMNDNEGEPEGGGSSE
jgi:phage-related protein (TIGR01555 family)